MMRIAALFALALLAWCAFARFWADAETRRASWSCQASWYGAESGRTTASGERFNPRGFTMAMRSHAFGHLYRVCYLGRCKALLHNDFGPAKRTKRCADISQGGAAAIGLIGPGHGSVSISPIR